MAAAATRPSLKVGDKLFLTISQLVRGTYPKKLNCVVTSVGRKYAYLDNPNYIVRLDNNGVVDKKGGKIIGQVWPDAAHYDQFIAHQKNWDVIRRYVRDRLNPPRNLQGEDLSFIIAALKIDDSAL